ncbi:MAG: hypothetical protein HOH43_22385 [Candidatus Latescibacteria bacterium]|nr:hypothetical protein [Candidatus Latescibacterota bacterium]
MKPVQALQQLKLPSGRSVLELNSGEMAAFRKLIGWEPGGPVVGSPTVAETEARAQRESWKSARAGRRTGGCCFGPDSDQMACFKGNINSDEETTEWWDTFRQIAEDVAALPLETFKSLIPDQGPWVFAGSFCPSCVGDKSPTTQHAAFWQWSVFEPDQITCPHCHTTYPHSDYPEKGHLDLPRLGLSYAFYLSEAELQSEDWRDGEFASNFAGIPTHVSFTGEIRTCKLAWVLGQVEPLGLAYAITGDKRYARIVRTILMRLAHVYPDYPVYSYGQEYIDADPAYAAQHIEALPTMFRRAASLGTYTGSYGGRLKNRGMDRTTREMSYYINGEWGSSRLGREKASNGQLFMTLFKGYDLVRDAIVVEDQAFIEQNFLLELYLDTRDFSQYVNNKSGPGAASRVAVGLFYDDEEALKQGLDQFHEILDGQFYPDGSWKETPIYGAKAIFEGMAEIPEMMRRRLDMYEDPLYRAAFETYASTLTPLGTQPSIGDSPAEYRLQALMVDLARIRMGLELSIASVSTKGFNLGLPSDIGNSSGYVSSLDDLVTGEARYPMNGPVGFSVVGHIPRKTSWPSLISMFNEPRPVAAPSACSAIHRHYEGNNLISTGFGQGPNAVQLYCYGGNGKHGHLHHAPLSLLLFAGGREVLPDLGYIADHPANAWVKSTASHNTVVVDEKSARPANSTSIAGFESGEGYRFFDVHSEVPSGDESEVGVICYRRALVMLPKPDGMPVMIDIFDVAGGQCHDYIVRANDPHGDFKITDRVLRKRESLYQDQGNPGPTSFQTAGSTSTPFVARWGSTDRMWAHVLTPADEIMSFKSPAWRNRDEVFGCPDATWDSLVLRKLGNRSRFIVVYDVGGSGPSIERIETVAVVPEVVLRLYAGTQCIEVTVEDGRCKVR